MSTPTDHELENLPPVDLPPVQVWARDATPDELVSVTESAKGKLTRRKRPAAALAETARGLGWAVRGPLYARGPWTVGKRAEEPNANGVRPTIPTTTIEDSFALRLSDPAGTQLAASWCGGKAEAWRWVICTHPAGRCPRVEIGAGTKLDPRREVLDCNVRRIPLDELKAIVAAGPRTEEAAPMPEPETDTASAPRGALVEEAEEAAHRDDNEASSAEREFFTRGYLAGHDAASAKAGDTFSEGYAAGLAAVAGREKVWVPAKRRLDALRPGDVILGKGEKWFTVTTSEADGRDWCVVALAFDGPARVSGNRSRRVDVVEEIALADALTALKDGDVAVTPLDPEEVDA